LKVEKGKEYPRFTQRWFPYKNESKIEFKNPMAK